MFIAISRKLDRNGDPTTEVAKSWIETNRDLADRWSKEAKMLLDDGELQVWSPTPTPDE